jgi:CHAD domain-containing protein
MARARDIPGLGPDMPMREAAALTVQTRVSEVFAFAGGVLDTGDIERVHDMRVATRRLRAALEVFRPCFPKPEFKAALRDVKALADALGARRDPDVALATVEGIMAHLPPQARAGVDAFEDDLGMEQVAGNATLEQALAHATETQLEARLLELAALARSPLPA